MPQLSHPRGDPEAAQAFKEELGARLEEVGIPAGTRVRVWVIKSIKKMRQALLPGLRRFWEDSEAVLSLVGRPWLHDQANATFRIK